MLTVRIHLDDTDEGNGGLYVIPGSHLHGVLDEKKISSIRSVEKTEIVKVKSGGVMLMKPLTLHASYKSVDHRHRRIIHIEFASKELPGGLMWRERLQVTSP